MSERTSGLVSWQPWGVLPLHAWRGHAKQQPRGFCKLLLKHQCPALMGKACLYTISLHVNFRPLLVSYHGTWRLTVPLHDSYFLFPGAPNGDNVIKSKVYVTAVAAAKSLQPCPTLCDHIDGSPPGSPVPGILQARTLEWVAISFSNA